MYWSDYHVHTHFSADSSESLLAYIRKAQESRINEICFTDHYDFSFPDPRGQEWMSDVEGLFSAIDALPDSGILIKKGVEMGVRLDEGIIEATEKRLRPYAFDFILASVHLVDGEDPYFPAYFEGKTKAQAFSRYIETLLTCLRQTDYYCAVGHIDYPSKGCDAHDAALQYDDAPDVLDSLFRFVAEKGKMLEINTSILKNPNAHPRDIRLWKRYVELGNDAVTMGSDAHSADFLGYEFAHTREFLREAGVQYIATFEQMQPLFTPI